MTGSENLTSRALKSADLNAVVDIDQRIVGYSRRGFFEKRLQAAVKSPKDYIVIGVTEESNLVGFTFARLHEGDFGTPGHFAALDAIGVDPPGSSPRRRQTFNGRFGRSGEEKECL